jgi:hypothetical protein
MEVDLRWGVTEEEAQSGKVLIYHIINLNYNILNYFSYVNSIYGDIQK